MWISGANRGLSGLIRKPKIWLLTGMYLFKDATFTENKKRTAGIQAGISSTLLSAVGGPPIGPSIDLGHSKDSSLQAPTQGWLVWAAQYRALDYRVGTRASGSADIKLLYDVVSEGILYYSSPDWSRGLTVEVTAQSNSLDDDARSASCDDNDYRQIAENFWRCRTSQRLTRGDDESFHVPKELTPAQQAKRKRWRQAKEEMRRAGSEVNVLHSRYLVPSQDCSEEQKQLLHDQFMLSEKAYKQALADFKSSLAVETRR